MSAQPVESDSKPQAKLAQAAVVKGSASGLRWSHWAGIFVGAVAIEAAIVVGALGVAGRGDRGAWEYAGQLGDTAGLFNALISALAFVAIAWTLKLQQEQLALQRSELEQQRDELKLQRDELARSSEAQRQTARLIAEAVFFQREAGRPALRVHGYRDAKRALVLTVELQDDRVPCRNLTFLEIKGADLLGKGQSTRSSLVPASPFVASYEGIRERFTETWEVLEGSRGEVSVRRIAEREDLVIERPV